MNAPQVKRAVDAQRRKLRIKTALKLLFSIAAISYVLLARRADLGDIFHTIGQASLPLIFVGLGLHVIGIFLSVIRWRYLLQAQGTDLPLWLLVKYLLVSFFFNVFLPTNIGGDIMRIVDTSRHARESVKPTAVILVERASGLLTLLGFMAVVLILGLDVNFPVQEKLPAIWLGVVYFIGIIGLIAFLSSARVARIMFAVFSLPLLNKAHKLLRRFYDAVMTYKQQPGLLAKALSTGLLLQLNYVIYYIVVARALGISSEQAPIAFFFLLIPIRDVLLLLPVAINGIGIRENFDATVFAWISLGSSHALAFSWLSWALGVFYALIGGIVYVARREEAAK